MAQFKNCTKKDPLSIALRICVWTAASLTAVSLLYLIGYIVWNGIPSLSLDFFSLHYNSENVSMLPSVINTAAIMVMALIVAVPLGVCSAIYLVEYAKRGNKLVSLIRVTSETLSGIPSIVYGLFGMIFFVTYLKMGYSLIAGALTVSIMVLPLILRTTEEALMAVPDMYREGCFGLGAGKVRTVFTVVLPAAMPGILAGVILAIGRIVGETAALIYTAGTVADLPSSPLNSGRTLAVHMYALSREGLHTDKAYATALMLLLIVLLINYVTSKLSKKVGVKNG